ncbi:MAG: type VI secretion system baseplate subunit TssG [Burkholderiales bacterium]|nr:type VI secretion system baseplate subunit TssG [Burkholderiales bacterium]
MSADPSAAVQALLDAVRAEPWGHDFFMLLRRIDALRPEAPRTGHTLRPGQEPLRLAQPPELDFAPAPLQALELRDELPPRLMVRFFGLLGPQGPLPLHLTEYARERQHQHKDPTFAHFLDLFHHRLLSLFHRAWAQAQPVVHLDRPRDDRYLHWLDALAGITPGASTLAAYRQAFHAGTLAGRSRHPEAICKVLRHEFGVPVAVQPHVGTWLAIDPRDRSRLGHAANRPERNAPTATAGRAANAGSRIWDRQYRFRVRLGPLTRSQYDDFLPGGRSWTALVEWLRLLAGDEMRWELELGMQEAQRPAPRLGTGLRLGVASWLPRRGGREGRSLRLRPATCFLLRSVVEGKSIGLRGIPDVEYR